MNQLEIKNFCKSFFVGTGCHIVEEGPYHMTVKLNIDTDKDIMNRPFYWVYVEKCGIPAEPKTLSIAFDDTRIPDSFQGELVTFGSARLHKIMESVAKRGRFTRLYQQDTGSTNRMLAAQPLIPWIGLQYNLQYVCDQKKNEIHSIGVNLFSGQIVRGFMDRIRHLPLGVKLPAYRHLLQGNLQVQDGIDRAELVMRQYLENEDMKWAIDAFERLEGELDILDSYYTDNKTEEWEQRREELVRLYSPRINIDLINCGLFYLVNGTISS